MDFFPIELATGAISALTEYGPKVIDWIGDLFSSKKPSNVKTGIDQMTYEV